LPLEHPDLRSEKRRLLRALAVAGVPLDRPFGRLGARHRRVVLDGNGKWPGVVELMGRLVEAEDGPDLEQFTAERPCAACGGLRLNPRARAVRLQERTITDVTALAIADAARLIRDFRFEAREATIADAPLKEILP